MRAGGVVYWNYSAAKAAALEQGERLRLVRFGGVRVYAVVPSWWRWRFVVELILASANENAQNRRRPGAAMATKRDSCRVCGVSFATR